MNVAQCFRIPISKNNLTGANEGRLSVHQMAQTQDSSLFLHLFIFCNKLLTLHICTYGYDLHSKTMKAVLRWL